MNAKSFNLRYVPELDGMRGFAILAVIMYHAHVPFLRGGFIGVDIFVIAQPWSNKEPTGESAFWIA
jgi:peptidoglycan/LPS O-acetylase OafA/YrhL